VSDASDRAPGGAPAGGSRRDGRRIVAALAVTQTVGYGALYYAFAVLLVPMATDLGLSTTVVTGALTASVLGSAVAAVPVGRWLDRHGGRGLMTAGSVTGTLLLLAAARVDGVVALYAVWTGIGLVTAAVLYEAAFAVVVAWHPEPRRRANAVLAVTVVAGFASSIFFPLTGLLVERYGWRSALVVLAVIHGLLTVPLHLLVRRPPGGSRRTGVPPAPPAMSAAPPTERRGTVAGAVRDRGFWILTAAFVAHTAAMIALSVHLVAYLVELGHRPAFAATIAGGLGVLSVTGRLLTTGAQHRWPTTSVVATVFAVQAAGALALPLVGDSAAGAAAAVLAFGLGFGVATIARPAILASRYGTEGFASLSGLLAAPLNVTKALAPLAAAVLHTATGDYDAVAAAVAACSLLSAAGIAASRQRR
jgi:MFS family permease